jgi:hypothetical protein
MADKFKDAPITLNAPASNLFAITKSDVTVFTQATRGIYVGTAGDLAVVTVGGDTVTLKNAAVGWHPVRATKVLSTGTAAADIVGAY